MHQIVIPKSELLKKYIASFNILNEFENSFTYHAFPQSGTEIILFKNTEITIDGNEIEMKRNLRKEPQAVFLGKYLKPLRVTYQNFVQKIAIHFTETGILNFFPNYFSEYGIESLQSSPLSRLELNSALLFSKNLELGMDYLEKYLLSIFQPNNCLPAIEQAMEILKQDLSIPTEQIASAVGMNKKTFRRQFKKHIGCTTSEYKRITRFKKTARNYFEGAHKNLVQLCYYNGYYDGSDFCRQVRKTTSLKPKDFFDNVKKMGPKNRIYIFE